MPTRHKANRFIRRRASIANEPKHEVCSTLEYGTGIIVNFGDEGQSEPLS